MFEQAQTEWLQGLRNLRPPQAPSLTQRIHCNTVWRGWLDALAAQYPSVVRHLGDESFEGLARFYLSHHAPTQPVLLDMGHDFPKFLAHVQNIDTSLVNAARADRAWGLAHVAADAEPMNAQAFSALWSAPETSLQLHPSAQLLSDLPGQDIHAWLSLRFPTCPAEMPTCGLLVLRVDDVVQAHALHAASLAFLTQASHEQSVASALHAALDVNPHLDLPAWGAWLWDTQVLCPTLNSPAQ